MRSLTIAGIAILLLLALSRSARADDELLTLERTIEVGRTPSFLEFGPRSGDLYVACAYDTAIRRLAARTYESKSWTRLSPVSPYGFVLPKDERQMILANFAADTLCWLDLGKSEITHTLTLEPKPSMVTLTPGGKTAVVACDRAQSVYFVSVSRREVESTPIVLSGAPHGMAFHPKGNTLFVVTGSPTPGFARVEWKSQQHSTHELDVLAQSELAISPKGDRLYFASAREGGTLLVVDAKKLGPPGTEKPPVVLEEIAIDGKAHALELVRKSRSLAAVLSDKNELVLVDLKKSEVQQRIATGDRPQDLAVSRDGQIVAVANRGSRNVSVYRLQK